MAKQVIGKGIEMERKYVVVTVNEGVVKGKYATREFAEKVRDLLNKKIGYLGYMVSEDGC